MSINPCTSSHPPNINSFNNFSASSTPVRTVCWNSDIVIRCPRYRNAAPSSSHNTFAAPPSLRRNPFPYDIHRMIVLNGVCDPSANHIRYSSINRATISTSTFSGSSGWSSKMCSNINTRPHHTNPAS
jgi:hypothetical protein